MKKISVRNLAISLILILSLTLGAGCTLQPTVDTAPPASPPVTENTTPIDTEWSIAPTESQAPILPSIADVVAKVKPAVVAINTEVVALDIFNRPRTQEGAGSGWVIRDDGIIITNNHVIEGAESITVTLDDGRTFPVDMDTLAVDPLSDLAVLKIDAQNLPAATVGDSFKLRVGDWVVAIGNSLGRGIRATVGIVSQQEVSIPVDQGQTLYGLIETDVAINPGNSGGPLVNMAGEVIGITSAKLASVEVEGVGYAISSNEAMPIIKQLINTGYVVRPWLGVSLYSVDEFVILRYDLAVDKGAFIVYVASGSPADKAGLQADDVIVSFDDKEINTVEDLLQAIHSAEIGQEVEIIFWRGEAKSTAYASLIESPPPS
ncbi:S1C family serine protease [Chloroflexota bacterium]